MADPRPGTASPLTIRVGTGSCGIASGAGAVLAALHAELAARQLTVAVVEVGCLGACYREPLVEIVRGGKSTLYGGVTPAAVKAIVEADIIGGAPVAQFIVPDVSKVLDSQQRIVLKHCGAINPVSLDDYRAVGGYAALAGALKLTPAEVIDRVSKSGLRGRGGAGFPTGKKWGLTAQQAEKQRYFICNADEGDPGAFMDRAVLESAPYQVLEGLTIASYATGASEAYIYCRAEYPLALKHLRHAIAVLEKAGLLGSNILGSGFSCHIHIKEGAGAFVCGEETALIGSIEGKRGMPRLRPPYPAVSGLFGKPTTINNVETLAAVPAIIRDGFQAFAALGTEKSKGTKVFALAGKIARGGLVEVPMGTTLRTVIMDIGGGIPAGRAFKAVQLGGPSGGCLPESLLDTPIDYEALMKTGAIVGSGGMVVMDDTTCMVDIARFFLAFTQKESCGKCTFCRIGTKRMLETLDRLCSGRGQAEDLPRLEELAGQIQQGSLCGLGQTAPNPVLTTLRYFRSEYEAHIAGRCPAGACRPLLKYSIAAAQCIGCTKCAKVCPVKCISGSVKKPHVIDLDKCIKCGQCFTVCPVNAVVKQ